MVLGLLENKIMFRHILEAVWRLEWRCEHIWRPDRASRRPSSD